MHLLIRTAIQVASAAMLCFLAAVQPADWWVPVAFYAVLLVSACLFEFALTLATVAYRRWLV